MTQCVLFKFYLLTSKVCSLGLGVSFRAGGPFVSVREEGLVPSSEQDVVPRRGLPSGRPGLRAGPGEAAALTGAAGAPGSACCVDSHCAVCCAGPGHATVFLPRLRQCLWFPSRSDQCGHCALIPRVLSLLAPGHFHGAGPWFSTFLLPRPFIQVLTWG